LKPEQAYSILSMKASPSTRDTGLMSLTITFKIKKTGLNNNVNIVPFIESDVVRRLIIRKSK